MDQHVVVQTIGDKRSRDFQHDAFFIGGGFILGGIIAIIARKILIAIFLFLIGASFMYICFKDIIKSEQRRASTPVHRISYS
jgi:uncharacterized membrane protein (Fun14 family)